MSTRVRPCFGQIQLFESTKPADHARAREFCLRCPDIDWCDGELQRTLADTYGTDGGPRGTWAGRLIGQRRTARAIRPNPTAARACLDCGAAMHNPAPARKRCPDCSAARYRAQQRAARARRKEAQNATR